MQEYGGGISNKPGEYRETSEGKDRNQDSSSIQHSRPLIQKNYVSSNKDTGEQTLTTYSRIGAGIETVTNQQYQNTRYSNPSAPTFSSPPNSPLVGLVFDPSSPKYGGSGVMNDRLNSDRRAQNSWSVSPQEPIGTGAKKKIVKSQDKRCAYNADPRYQERYKDTSTETDNVRKHDRNFRSESTSSLDFFVEGERMVSELCNISDSNTRRDHQKPLKLNREDDKNRLMESSEVLLTALDRIVIHDQIPNQIVQLAIEACTDAENIAIAHHNRPCFKNIHSICAKTRSNVQKPDSAVANLHSQGIPWVIKNFIFSFVRILDGWKGVKELLSEKHDTFSRIENKYYSQNIRECFVQWQAVTNEMLTHIYKTFKCLDHGFTMEQKSFTHNYYATNSAAPRHQSQNKFQTIKQHINTPRPINASPQTYNVMQPPWVQAQAPTAPQPYAENQWPPRSTVTYKKFPVVPPLNTQNFYSLNDQSESETYQKSQYKCDPCSARETKPRQSWTITNAPDFRSLEGMCHADHREMYTQLKHRMDAELGKAPGQPILSSMPCDALSRREVELKPKMIPLSHVEKTLIPNMATQGDIRTCYVQKNNSCGDTMEDIDFFAAWGQMAQRETSEYLIHQPHNTQSTNVVTISNNISGPVQFIDTENDEFHEMSKVYMKPGSYKVPIKPADPLTTFLQSSSQENVYSTSVDDSSSLKIKSSFSQVTLAPQPKYSIESWPCLMSRRAEEVYSENPKINAPLLPISCLDMRAVESFDILSSMMSDQAWEAAKQSAPKLIDFIHEDSKTDTARLYDALGLNATEEISREFKQLKPDAGQINSWYQTISYKTDAKQLSSNWNQISTQKSSQDQNYDNLSLIENVTTIISEEQCKPSEVDDQDVTVESSIDESKTVVRPRNFDQSGSYIRDDSQKKSSKSKVAVSGMWYHPKKKKPLSNTIVKKFENIISTLLQNKDASLIQDDMDIKIAPRFYEVVKYPMCLNDISTKLKNSSYTEYEQVVQDFRRTFNNVRLYLKSYPDSTMKKSINKVSAEFEKILNEEFQNKWDSKSKTHDNIDAKDPNNKKNEKEDVHKQEIKKTQPNEKDKQ